MPTSTLIEKVGLISRVGTLRDRISKAMGEITPAAFSRQIGVSPAAVSLWLSGATKSLKAEHATKIEQATGYRATWLVTGNGPEKGESLFDRLTDDEREMLDNFRALMDDDRAELAAEIQTRAARTRAHVEKALKSLRSSEK